MKCAVCEEEVVKGTGVYKYRKLIHEKCVPQMKMTPWRFE